MLGFMSFTNTRPISSIPMTNPIPKRQTLFPLMKFKSLKKKSNRASFSEESSGGGEEDDDLKKRPRLNLRWSELLFDPDPDNVVAVGLTGVLAWASVQVLWQLFVISFAILIAAVKYSFVAAILIFILITLL
ncbi:hypothetical protein L1987_61387 [Smallanthus sonchifolius]|uniref:Uncharacterized protein n=1 Tax=Smallanthus sonchifolius TaxID=185202 RepID=A0ACB9C7R7_9ASTR|nr:hypothetical protein L1987_61387 [Smallanthus sonchifolius]